MDIFSFEYKGQQIDMTVRNGFLACTFEIGNETFGSKLKLESRGTMAIVSAATLLIINAIESIDKLKK